VGARWSGALVILALTACSGQGNAEAENVRSAANRFAATVDTDTGAACGLLAPGTLETFETEEGPCAQELSTAAKDTGGSVESVEVYGKDAVAYLSGDTLFLARFPQGWRVTAAGCTKKANRPYDCAVRGA
jgi:hypothetical protein